jgi:aspartokinase/homoserine dehydrogenase 1
MNNLLVMKFGGTSMGSAERIRVAAAICTEQKAQRPVLAVVSAMSGVTDLLLGALRHAEADDEAGIESSIRSLSERHEKTCHELLGEPARCDRALAGIRDLIADFRRIAHGMLMLGDRPPKSVDEAIAIGERLSALMIAEYLESTGIAARAINSAEVIVTDAVFGNATPIMEATRRKAGSLIEPLLATGVLPVLTGFNGATVDGRPTTLGRGGSDFSASILAAALDASELWIWTDVDGIMSADPRSVREARVLDALTYNEAAELAYNGAKVLHPRTLAPLIERQIPVWSKNSFHREHPGTRIISTVEAPSGPRAVTSIAHVARKSWRRS